MFALPKFTIPDDKKLVVEMYEKQGGRHQIFEVDNEDLVRAETINVLQVRCRGIYISPLRCWYFWQGRREHNAVFQK